MQKAEALIYIRKPGDPKDPIDIPSATSGILPNQGMRLFDNHTFVMIYSTWLSVPPPIPVAFLIRVAARICVTKMLSRLGYYKRRLRLYLKSLRT